MLAGDVSVALVNDGGFDILQIEGDDSGNKISIVSDGTTVTVTGNGTDVNGEREPLQFSTASIDGYVIDLRDGNDQVTLTAENNNGSGFEGILAIATGAGNDRVKLIANNGSGSSSGFSVGALAIETSGGNDRVEIIAENDSGIGFVVGGDFTVGTGGGNDRITIEAASSANSSSSIGVYGSLEMDSGNGNDRLTVESSNQGSIVAAMSFDANVGSGKKSR